MIYQLVLPYQSLLCLVEWELTSFSLRTGIYFYRFCSRLTKICFQSLYLNDISTGSPLSITFFASKQLLILFLSVNPSEFSRFSFRLNDYLLPKSIFKWYTTRQSFINHIFPILKISCIVLIDKHLLFSRVSAYG